MSSRLRTVRLALLATLVVLAVPFAMDYATRGQKVAQNVSSPIESNNESLPDAVTGPPGHLAFVVDAWRPGQLTVINRTSGERVYKETKWPVYHDVDPSPKGTYTLQYIASEVKGKAQCPDRLKDTGRCTRNAIVRLNYSTGERKILYSHIVNYNGSSNTHDVDRLAENRFLIGDIHLDRIYIANTETNETVWRWEAESEYSRSSGGQENDWTHLNDVEVIREDLYLVNLRNQDQVVFVDRQHGLLENRTLGEDDNHAILYEQHNPDYIPEERGGPALVIADSENNRVVEYQRHNGTWTRTWVWADETTRWPRDADRLPNNNTLITDTHGTRLIEVAPNGSIVWTYDVPRGVYEAELLSTGDESTGGRSMVAIQSNLTRNGSHGISDTLQRQFLDIFPSLILNGFLYVLPTWVSPLSGALLFLDIIIVVLWIGGESARGGLRWYWS